MMNVRRNERRNVRRNVRRNFDICPNCGAIVENDRFDCPECGVVVKIPPRRKVEAKRDFITTTESENMNGRYNIYVLSDGSLFCDCRAFLLQKRVWEENNQLVCKHIQKILDSLPQNLKKQGRPLTEWQKILLKKLNIEPHPSLTREQAYWIIRELLLKMDLEYGDLIKILKKNPSFELLPLTSYGLELEGLVKDRNEFYERLKEIGFKVILTGYSHEMGNELWKVGDDGSVRRSMNDEERSNYKSVELTTPKLYSVEGFKKIKMVLDIWNKIGAAVNNSCGFHVHIDASNFLRQDLARLLLVWMRIEPVVYFLVSPSRRENSYTRLLRKASYHTIARMLFGEINEDDRYHALNLVAFKKYRTVEFRLHQGTTNFEKVKNWTIFCLKLMEKVKSGLKWYHISEEPTVEEVLDKLGITDNAVPIIQNARKFLIERYNHFKEEGGNPDLFPFEPTVFKRYLIEALDKIYSKANLVFHVDGLPDTHYVNLASESPRTLYSYDSIMVSQQGNIFTIGRYKVKFDEETKEISCSCPGFKQYQRCSHSICVARYLYVNEKYKELVEHLDDLDF